MFDTITDFKHGEDKIVFDDAVFAALGTSIGASEFLAAASGHAATNSAQHLIYDNSTGELWFDSNGNANGHAWLVAKLGTVASHPTNLTYTDFGII